MVVVMDWMMNASESVKQVEYMSSSLVEQLSASKKPGKGEQGEQQLFFRVTIDGSSGSGDHFTRCGNSLPPCTSVAGHTSSNEIRSIQYDLKHTTVRGPVAPCLPSCVCVSPK